MSINLVKDIEANLSKNKAKTKAELDSVWIESQFAIMGHDSTDNGKYRIDQILDKFDHEFYIDTDVVNMEMFIENYGWVDVMTEFDEANIVFIANTVTKFRNLVFLPKLEKKVKDLNKDIDATQLREMFLETILPDIKKAIDKKTTHILLDGYLSNDMEKFLNTKGLNSSYVSNSAKTKIYF